MVKKTNGNIRLKQKITPSYLIIIKLISISMNKKINACA